MQKAIKILPLFALLLVTDVNAEQHLKSHIQSVQARDGGEFRVETINPGEHFAAAVLLQGGKGKLKIKDSGIKAGKKNFLVHFRHQFTEKGLLVAVADAPADYYSKKGMLQDQFRLSQAHADDLGAVIRKLRGQTDKPVWLIGTSRGTISAVNAAVRLQGTDAPDGLVLTASVVETSKGKAQINDMDLADIKVPVLLTHHVGDDCRCCPFSGAQRLKADLINTPVAELKAYRGGEYGYKENRCNRLSPHGFLGQEAQVIQDIVSWMKMHNPY